MSHTEWWALALALILIVLSILVFLLLGKKKWISTNRRLPHPGSGVFMYIEKFSGVGKFRAGKFVNDDEWLFDAGILRNNEISHWQLLPERPNNN